MNYLRRMMAADRPVSRTVGIYLLIVEGILLLGLGLLAAGFFRPLSPTPWA